ncbi:hypothetical protein B0H66DRAFT_555130 [Apodospora peruviana]|uniref:Ankyrin repeat protein n=1 Tax=Apodospora peruviana TaxID=516989 RepID=A0AAE0ID13_9PEZI|nr:hypothetical protein B0H66DRAFT_555130 [Apodospora peruviana]
MRPVDSDSVIDDDDDGGAPLGYAAENGNPEIVQQQSESSRDIPTDPLWRVALNGDKDVMCHLFGYGSYMYEAARDRTLFEASKNRQYEVVEIPIRRGARLGFRDTAGMTALHHAAYDGHLEIAKSHFASHRKAVMQSSLDSWSRWVQTSTMKTSLDAQRLTMPPRTAMPK